MTVSTQSHSQTITTITKEDVNAYFKKASIELDLTFEPDGDNLTFKLTNDTNPKLVVGYLNHDPHPTEWDEFGYEDGNDDFEDFSFRSVGDRDDYVAEQKEAGRVCFIVNKYQHGQVHYSVAGTRSYPDMRWDVSPCGVFTPCEENQERFKRGDVTEAQLIEWANQTLDTYSDYCNGATYGCCVDTFEVQADGSFEKIEDEACWGLIGHEQSQKSLENDFMSGLVDVPKYEPASRADLDDTPTL